MLKAMRCDLHVHTCLSPCADLDMYPGALVRRFLEEKLDIVAICDHNASENVPYILRLAEGKPLTILPGMEITSQEEVHVLALFDRLEPLQNLQKVVYDHLMGLNSEDVFGYQPIVNEHDEVEGFNEHLLIGATSLSIQQVIDHIHRLGGAAIASHVDRQSFSVIGQLGFIGPDMPFDALEVSHVANICEARYRFPELESWSMVTSSDAHFVTDIGKKWTRIYIDGRTITELKLAFHKQAGRYIEE